MNVHFWQLELLVDLPFCFRNAKFFASNLTTDITNAHLKKSTYTQILNVERGKIWRNRRRHITLIYRKNVPIFKRCTLS